MNRPAPALRMQYSPRTVRWSALVALALVGPAVMPSAVLAQRAADESTTVARASTAPAPGPFGPRITADPFADWAAPAPVGPPIASDPFVERAAANPLEASLPQDRVGAGTNVAMMVVGGAALVVGLAIGDDTGMIIATGGAVIGLVGLYRYLR